MADITKLNMTFTDGTTVLNASIMNAFQNKINEVIDKVNGGVTPTQTVATPTIYISGTTATISCSTSGATIYYTTNGNTPTTSSTQYSSPITLSGACTIKAIAVKSGMNNSSVASKSYSPSVQPVVPTMALNTTAKTVALSATSGLTIKYSTDGSTPTTTYSSPINVASGATIKAISTNGSQSSPTPKIGIKFNAAESSNLLDVSSMSSGFEDQSGVRESDSYRYIRIDMSEYPVGTVFSFIDSQNQPIQARWSGYVDADGNAMRLPGTMDYSFKQNQYSREKLAADEKYLSVSFATSLGDSIGVFVGENPEWGGEQTMEFVTSEVGTIRYTTNGSEPTSSSSAYSSAITPVSGTTYKVAVYNGSTLASETETIQITS